MPFPFTRSTFDHWEEKYRVHPTNASYDQVEVDGGGELVVWEKVVAYITIPLLSIITVLVLVRQNLDRLNQFCHWAGAFALELFDRVRACIGRHRARGDSTYEMAEAPPLPSPRPTRQNRTDSERVRELRGLETCV